MQLLLSEPYLKIKVRIMTVTKQKYESPLLESFNMDSDLLVSCALSKQSTSSGETGWGWGANNNNNKSEELTPFDARQFDENNFE